MKLLLDRFLRTCTACPSQWDGITDDGRAVYVRYRWGGLSVRVAAPNDLSEYAAVRGEEILYTELGDGFDGFLSDDELKEVLVKHGLVDADAVLGQGALTRAELDDIQQRTAVGLRKLIEEGIVTVIETVPADATVVTEDAAVLASKKVN